MTTTIRTTLLAAATLCAAACDSGAPEAVDVAALDLVGTRIDGSEDPGVVLAADEVVPADAETGAALESAEDPAPDETAGGTEATPPAPSGADDGEDAAPDEAPAPAAEAEASAERGELGRLRDDGVRVVPFTDLSLEGHDKEAIVDSLIFPEDYDEALLPAPIAALSGQTVEITGYMIPGRIARGGNVRDFMLVRDLLGCCFGGMPQPDEWIDVVMEDDSEAEYVRYMPIKVTGVLSVGEEMDENSFNPAVFKMVASTVERKE